MPATLSQETKLQTTTISEGNKLAALFQFQSYAEMWKKDDSNTTIMQVKLTLLAVIKKIGITNLPDENLLGEFAKYILRYYADFNSKEILYAFELYSSQRLSVPEFKTPFNSFNTVLISIVLNAYRDIRNKKIREAAKKEEQEKEEKLMNMSEEEMKEYAAKMYQITIDYIREYKKMSVYANWLACYAHLKNKKLLSLLSQKEQDSYIQRAYKEAESRDLNKIASGREFDARELQNLKNNQNALFDACRELRVRDHFQDVIFQLTNNPTNGQTGTNTNDPEQDF